jgi:hypothetical protein
MKINVKVISNASRNKIVKEESFYKAYITAQREKGKANKALIKLLSSHFKISKSRISILKGELSNKKLILLNEI